MENQTIEQLKTLIRLKELQRLTNTMKAWKVKDLENGLYIAEYHARLRHNVEIHDKVLERLQERFNRILHNLTINN